MFSRSNLRQVKTTVIGLLILAVGIAYPIISDSPDVWILGILLIAGISMVFLPNDLLAAVKNLMKSNSGKKF